MQELPIAANGSFGQRPTPAHSLWRRWAIVLLPVLTIGIVGGSLFWLQWVGQYAIALGYPVPQVRINGPSTSSLVRQQSYQFSGVATGRNLTYVWDFGDQNTAYGPIVSHVYQQNGPFTITLTVSDPTGQSTKQTYTVNVVPPAPQAIFTTSVSSYGGGGYVYFYANGSTADQSTSISSYNWTFGDGTTDTTSY